MVVSYHLVIENAEYPRGIWDTMLKVWTNQDGTNRTNQDQTHQHNQRSIDDTTPMSVPQHMIWGSEELDRFGKTPSTHRDGIQTIRRVVDQMPPTHLDLVVNYRRPRQDQWISIWRQEYRKELTSKTRYVSTRKTLYKNFLCDADQRDVVWEYLDCVANPLGLVAALLETFPTERTTVYIMDMQGIAEVNRDVGHVIACDVLEVPCTTQHWLPNLENTPIKLNERSGHPGLTSSQLEDMGWLLRQRDCSYRRQLQEYVSIGTSNNSHTKKNTSLPSSTLILHYADTIWDGCDDDPDDDEEEEQEEEGNAGVPSFPSRDRFVRNTTWLFEHLQSQVGCGPLSRTA